MLVLQVAKNKRDFKFLNALYLFNNIKNYQFLYSQYGRLFKKYL